MYFQYIERIDYKIKNININGDKLMVSEDQSRKGYHNLKQHNAVMPFKQVHCFQQGLAEYQEVGEGPRNLAELPPARQALVPRVPL